MKKCTKCGCENSDQSNFCSLCGQSLSNVQIVITPQPSTSSPKKHSPLFGILEIGIGLLSIAMFLLPWIEVRSSMFSILSTQNTASGLDLIEAGIWPITVGYIFAWLSYAVTRYVKNAPKWLKVVIALVSLLCYGYFVVVFIQGIDYTVTGPFGLDVNTGGRVTIKEGALLALAGAVLLFVGAVTSTPAAEDDFVSPPGAG